MKYIIGMMLVVSLLLPMSKANASIINNRVSDSDFSQYIFFDCSSASCIQLVSKVLVDNSEQIETPVSDQETEPDVEIVVDVTVDDDQEDDPSTDSDLDQEEDEVVEDDEDPSSDVDQDEDEDIEEEIVEEDDDEVVDDEEEEPEPIEYAWQTIRINEIMAAPETGEDEWVELYNPTLTPVNLSGWTLEEGAGQSTELFGTITNDGYLVFDKNNLNNSGDIILLKDATGNVVDEISYGNWDDGDTEDNAPATDRGETLSLIDDVYYISDQITKGAENEAVLVEVEPEPSEVDVTVEDIEGARDVEEEVDELEPMELPEEPIGQVEEEQIIEETSLVISGETSNNSETYYEFMTIAAVRNQNLKDQVMVKGQVAVTPGTFGKNYLYLFDGQAGTQVYFSKANWPELKEGDTISVAGYVSQSQEEKRINVRAKEDLAILEPEVKAEPLLVDEVNQSLVGALVQIEATLVEKASYKMYMANELGEFTVNLKQGSEIDSSLFKVEDQLLITGVLVQVKDNLYLQPRSQADFENISLEELPVVGALTDNEPIAASGTKQTVQWTLISAFILLSIINAALLLSRVSRRKLRKPLYRLREMMQTN
jgi:hypothetical protein